MNKPEVNALATRFKATSLMLMNLDLVDSLIVDILEMD